MQIFKFPYILIPIFIVCFFLLGGLAIYLILRSMKTEVKEETEFTSISKLERCFIRSGNLREKRSLIYISVSLDNYRSLHSLMETEKVGEMIENLLCHSFSSLKNGFISSYEEYSYIVYLTLDKEKVRGFVEEFNASLTKCLLDCSALNVIEVNIGTSFADASDISFDEAISRAKQACVLAKNKKITYVEWDFVSGKALERKIKIENNIESEIDNNRFFLVYQPVLDAKTKKIIGAEALSRLYSLSEGVLQPGSFLSAVDSVRINHKFDYYIFEKNCKWISNDKKQREKYQYTINFSRSTMSEPEFAEKILSIVKKYGLKPSCLAVEILEDKSIIADAKHQMIENLKLLKENGISILLDDFGSGYTMFDDLQNLDISVVKIDSAITRNSITENGYIILENIIHTAKNLGFKTLCEGVETKEHEDAVLRAGCDLLQGFYYYKPMPAAMLEILIGKAESESETT